MLSLPHVMDLAPLIQPDTAGPTEGCSHKLIAEGSRLEITPIFFAGGERLKEHFDASTGYVPPVSIYYINNLYVLGHGIIINANGKPIVGPPYFPEQGRVDFPANRSLLKESNYRELLKVRELNCECALITQAGEQVYGHWIVDLLPRVALLEKEGYSGKYVLRNGVPEYAQFLLARLGVCDKRIVTYNPRKEALLIKNGVIPSYLRFRGAMSDIASLAYIRLAKITTATPQRKIYLSRSGWGKNQKLINAEELESIARKKGFDVVCPEKLTIDEQLSLFAETKVLVGEYGSAMHNSAFCPSGTKVIVLQSIRTPHFVQAGLSKAMGQEVGFLFGRAVNECEGIKAGRCFVIDPKSFEWALSPL